MNFGILGCGKIAHRFVGGLNDSKSGVLKAVASQSQERLMQFTDKYNVKGYESYEALLNDESIEVVYIATYNPSHKALIELCLKHKKHVICEKPMLRNAKDVKEMFAYARAQGCFLMEAQKAVFLPILDDAKAWIDTLGTPLIVSADYTKDANHPQDHWVRDPYFGGSMKDVGCYPLSVVYHLFGGQYDAVSHHFIYGERGADDFGNIILLKDRVSITVKGSYDVTLDNTLKITGPKGSIEAFEFWKANSITATINNKKEVKSYPKQSEFSYYIDHCIECIEKGLLESPIMSEAASLFCLEHAPISENIHG